MSLESLKENILYEKEIIKEMFIFKSQLEQVRFLKNKKDETLINQTLKSLLRLLVMTNNSIPKLISEKEIIETGRIKGEIAQVKEDKAKKAEKKKLIKVSYAAPEGKKEITIKKEDEKKFTEELSLSLSSIKKLKKRKRKKEKTVKLFKKTNFYAKFSNKLFLKYSNRLVKKGYIEDLNTDLRKANLPYLINTYISMALMTALIGLFGGIISSIIIILIAQKFIYLLLIPGAPLLVLASFYFYPALEKGNIAGKVNQELPFVVIHMSAIAGSGIEPSQIFKIIALSREYKYSGQELRKVINQINVYGYDLVNSLKNAARSTASRKIAELFNGLATTISSGGNLNEFLDKRADSLLFEYRLEREKFTRAAETFMDIYISVVIAAPMIMMLMLILLSITNIGLGLSIQTLSLIIVLIVALINVVFLVVLHLKQPTY